jgi:hypothetical protein
MRTRKNPIDLSSRPDTERRVAERLKDIAARSPSRAVLFRSVYTGKPSKALAVKAKCLDCCCWQSEEIKQCQSVTCPLWRVRPYQNGPPRQTQGRGKRFYESQTEEQVKTAEAS